MSNNIKENQIVSIVGATATGKTAFALQLAKQLLALKKYQRVRILSADSRQVYQGLENLTGADVPTAFKQITHPPFKLPYFVNKQQNIVIHGLAMISPAEEWSVAHFARLFQEIKGELRADEILLMVGGTAFYQQQVNSPAETLYLPPNQALRAQLAKLTVEALQEQLQQLAPAKYQGMNRSDLHNPRRLVRAIEVATYHQDSAKLNTHNTAGKTNLCTFYLQLNKTDRERKIKQRVQARFAKAKQEVETMLILYPQQQLTAFSSSGFQALASLLRKEITVTECLKRWQLAELQYAKRQDTWWKKTAANYIIIDNYQTKTIPDKILQACYI